LNTLDLQTDGLRTINKTLQFETERTEWTVTSPMGQHAIACGLTTPINVTIEGHTGFYTAGMNQEANVTINGHTGVGVAENMMSGTVRVKGNASQAAGATQRP